VISIGITGASGMLATALIERLHSEYRIYATSRSKGVEKDQVSWQCFDLLDDRRLKSWLVGNNLDVIIHCAAIVKVDQCEKKPDIAENLHYRSTKIIADHFQKNEGQLIYISTDSLFDGKKITLYTEKDKTNPLNAYAKTKLLGEKPVLKLKNGLVLRTNIIGRGNNKNLTFAEWVVEGLIEKKAFTLFNDVFFSPLHVNDLADIIVQLIKKKTTGLFNAVSSNSLSKYEFGLKVADIFNIKDKVIIKGSIRDKKLIAKRPCNMGLSSNKLSAVLNKRMPSIERSIQLLKNQYENN
jgi:dTDP-4-dehydrorhamnose reductase